MAKRKKNVVKKKSTPRPNDKVKIVMEEFKEGKLRSGGSGKQVTNPKQAIAIALSEQRRKNKKKK